MRVFESNALYIDLLGEEIHVSIPAPTSTRYVQAVVPANLFFRAVANGCGAWSMAKATIRAQAARIRNLKRTITHAKSRNEERNRQLDALGMVWCDGGCGGGMARYGALGFGPSDGDKVTAEHVAALLENAGRALCWYVNREYRRARFSGVAADEAHARVEALVPVAYRWVVSRFAGATSGGPDCLGLGEDSIA